MKTLDEIYAAALAVDPVSYRVGNEKFERFVKCATPVAVTGMIDEIRSLRQKLEAAESALREAREQKPVQDDGFQWHSLYYHAPPQSAAIPECYQEEWSRNVMLMWSCVRKHDSRIPSDVLDFMREFLLSAAPKPEGE